MRHDRKPESGRCGSANALSYTYWVVIMAVCGAGWYIKHDTSPGGPHFIPCAYGVEPSWKLWTFLVVHGVLAAACVSVVAMTYHKFTGYDFVQDRIGFARAGGSDIANWVGLIVNGSFVAVFAFIVPPNYLGVMRPYVLIVIASFTAFAIARIVATVIFRAILGDPNERY